MIHCVFTICAVLTLFVPRYYFFSGGDLAQGVADEPNRVCLNSKL